MFHHLQRTSERLNPAGNLPRCVEREHRHPRLVHQRLPDEHGLELRIVLDDFVVQVGCVGGLRRVYHLFDVRWRVGGGLGTGGTVNSLRRGCGMRRYLQDSSQQ